jgi:hypothetical protein
LSPAATDILKRMMCESEKRLGVNGVDEIKNHPFFDDVDWEGIRGTEAPYQPELKGGDTDVSNFDHFDEEEPWNYQISEADKKANRYKPRKVDLHFVGYTYKKDVEEQR